MASQSADLNDLPPRPHVPARQVLLSAAALWLTYFVLITVRGVVVDLGEFHELLWRRALVTIAGIAITLLAWPVLRRFDGRSSGVRIAAALVIMLPAALALAAINQQAFAPVEQKFLDQKAQSLQREMDQAEVSRRSLPDVQDSSIPPDPPTFNVSRDVSGNVLVDVSEPPAPSRAPPVAAAKPQAPRPPKAPAPPNPEAEPVQVEDGGADFVADAGISIVHRADGLAEIRVGQRLVVTDTDHADEVADDLARAQEDIARAQEEVRRGADAARYAARQTIRREMLRSLADEGLIPDDQVPPEPPAPPAPPAAAKAPRAARLPYDGAGRATPTTRPAAATTATPAPLAPEPPAPQASAVSASQAAIVPPVPSDSQPLANAVMQKLMQHEGLWRQLTDVALGRYFLLIAWAALYLALGNSEMARASERREGEYKRAAKAAELRSLRYQVNPHFLFNTLNSLSALVMVGRSEQAERMIQTISSFYRHSLAGDPSADVPLADEIALQRHYLEIEAVRFPERLRCEFDVPAALENACVPGMILQPLVENSIKYGVSASTGTVTLRIAAEEAGGQLVLTVADDGPGKSGQQGGTGIGLENVRSRLAARFGDSARVESGALPAGGYATVLTIPLIRSGCD